MRKHAKLLHLTFQKVQLKYKPKNVCIGEFGGGIWFTFCKNLIVVVGDFLLQFSTHWKEQIVINLSPSL